MRHLVAALALTIPAEPVSDVDLQRSFSSCVEACGPGHARAFCNEICGCMTGEMGRHWDVDDFRGRAERLSANPEDADVLPRWIGWRSTAHRASSSYRPPAARWSRPAA